MAWTTRATTTPSRKTTRPFGLILSPPRAAMA